VSPRPPREPRRKKRGFFLPWSVSTFLLSLDRQGVGLTSADNSEILILIRKKGNKMDTQFCEICDNYTPVVLDTDSDEACQYCYDAYAGVL
jgi:hypothetical protein